MVKTVNWEVKRRFTHLKQAHAFGSTSDENPLGMAYVE
jgi:hypothetical protein